MKTERIAALEELHLKRSPRPLVTRFAIDYHYAGLHLYSDLPLWEKAARSMAYAIDQLPIFVEETDRIGGRASILFEDPLREVDPDLDFLTGAANAVLDEFPDIKELQANQLVGYTGKGHITWYFDRILSMGITGLKAQFEDALTRAADQEASEFYQGVIIMLDALQAFNDKHISAYREMGNDTLADCMAKVPRYPAETFREAVQSFYMQYIIVMKENPFGGNGPGRLDYYLWPYLEQDIAAGRCTLEEAKEIIDELFLRIDERISIWDGWVEAITVGGSHPNGSSAVNPLTYIMIESIIDLNITHPCVYVRLPKIPDEKLLSACARYLLSGKNRAQVLYDPTIIAALMKRGMFYRDAVEYACGGCMEIAPQGSSSDFIFNGWHNVPKLLEVMITGGICLKTGKKLNGVHADKDLAGYATFEEFYQAFMDEARRLNYMFLREQDIYSEYSHTHRPSYLISSMMDDCLARGRNMHAGGARYHDYGCAPVGIPNVVDGLFAIKEAVFEQKICTAEELIAAMKANYQGYERLQAQLRQLPKYGNNIEEIDTFAHRVFCDYNDTFSSYRNRFGGVGKPIYFTFTFSAEAAAILGATPDGRNAGLPVAHGVTPHSASMTSGITSAILSTGKLPCETFTGGASTMWDMDSEWATQPLMEAILKTFLQQGGQIFQGNTTPLKELLLAQEHPEDYPNLIVRVGGYSARFTGLGKDLQDEIIGRIRHKK
ncbi:MAG: hypothetical protein E7335_11870 [Clostridiales bacterium]|nr:hypothetical protein [Clostridiales bacterium]